MMTRLLPTVTVAVPVLNEERHLRECLDSIKAQTYRGEIEILVVDGGSVDSTRSIARQYSNVEVLDNPGRLQAAGLNVALEAAQGDVFVRVDGHSTIAPEFVQRSVEALQRTGAAMVGASVRPRTDGPWIERAMAIATVSSLGAGPAPFRVGGPSRWVDTVFLSSFWTAQARALGGYDEGADVNEDPEFAYRMGAAGGVWYEEQLDSTYVPRGTLGGIAAQYYRYGTLRAGMVRRHPSSLAPRQLAAPMLLVALLTPWRKRVLVAYALLVAGIALRELPNDPAASAGIVLTVPCMHVPWAVGFFAGLTRQHGVEAPSRASRRSPTAKRRSLRRSS